MSATTRWHKTFFSALFALLLIGVPGISSAKTINNQQNEYGNLGGAWWEWAFDTGFAQFGEGDVDCGVGQSGGVWYLAGTSGGAAERNCTIPMGKRLFFPLANQLIFFEEGVDDEVFDLTLAEKRIFLDSRVGGGTSSDDPGVAALYAFLNQFFDFFSVVACDLHATLDGEPLIFTTPTVRAQSGPVTITTDEEALADGFYIRLDPLDAGEHVLEFGSASCDVENLDHRDFETTVIYNLTVEDSD
jgi:hypothetical protein